MTTGERTNLTFGDRSLERLARVFSEFGRFEAPQLSAHLYEALCARIAEDPELLAIAAQTAPSQPPPNMLFAAVHYLLLDEPPRPEDADQGGAPLRHYYPDLLEDGETVEDPAAAYPAFRAYVLAHRPEIETLVATRRTQTNVIQRCTVLLPAFAEVHRQASEASGRELPLALIEIGPSLGLNLLWDRYAYSYEAADGARTTWGNPASPVQLPCDLRGATPLPPLPEHIPVASRLGIEYDRIDLEDDDAIRWLRALIWPEHTERHARLAAAIALARQTPPGQTPPDVVEADATAYLPTALAAAPAEAALCVYATHALYQIDDAGRRRIFEALTTASATRPIWFLTMEGTPDSRSELLLHHYNRGARTIAHLANANPHGRWLEWLAPQPR